MENQHKVKNNNHLFFFLVLEKLAKKTCYGLFFRWRKSLYIFFLVFEDHFGW